MATNTSFGFGDATDGSVGCRNQQIQHHILPEVMENKGSLHYATNDRPVSMAGRLGVNPHALDGRKQASEYDESDGPIYHQVSSDRQAGYARPWNHHLGNEEDATKNGEISVADVIGIKDICGNKRLWRMLIAEFIGTLFLVLIGCGSTLSGWSPGYVPQIVQIAFCYGLCVATLAQALGHVSGCHLNPAVSLALVAAGKCSVLKAILFMCCQCTGAIVGSAILAAVTPVDVQGNMGVTLVNDKLDTVQALFIEALITFVLALTVCGVCDDLRKDIKGSAPLAIGLSITVCHLFAIPYTGSSMNPARSLGPAVISKIWTHHWVYWSGPLLGAGAAGFIYQLAFRERPENQ